MKTSLEAQRDADDLSADEEKLHATLLREVLDANIPYPEHLYEGRGIVICGGGLRYFPCAWVCLKMLRLMGCTLPVEIWHLGGREFSPAMEALIRPYGARGVDASAVRKRHPIRILNGWELKPYAITHSSFESVLLLDADNVPIVDPTFLFSTPEFFHAGAAFWPDFGRLSPERRIWDLCSLEYVDEPEFESGQILVNKRECWKALHICMHLNAYSDFYYQHIHGDKETFHLAWRMLEQKFAMPARGIDALHCTMCQHDFQGRRIFQHRNLAKWTLHGSNESISGFDFENQCMDFLEELRSLWTPDLIVPTVEHASSADIKCQQEKQKLAKRKFIYERIGYDQRVIELQSDGRIGEGHAGREMFWNVARDGDRIALQLFDDAELTAQLFFEGNGIWRGCWERFEKMPVTLTPV